MAEVPAGVGLLWSFGLGLLGLRGRHFGFGTRRGLGLALGDWRWGRGDGRLGIPAAGAAVGEDHAFQFAGIVLGVEHDEVEAGAVEQRDQGFAKRLRGNADYDLFLTASGRDGDVGAGLAFDLVEDLGQADVVGLTLRRPFLYWTSRLEAGWAGLPGTKRCRRELLRQACCWSDISLTITVLPSGKIWKCCGLFRSMTTRVTGGFSLKRATRKPFTSP